MNAKQWYQRSAWGDISENKFVSFVGSFFSHLPVLASHHCSLSLPLHALHTQKLSLGFWIVTVTLTRGRRKLLFLWSRSLGFASMTYYEEDGRKDELVPELRIRVAAGDDDIKGHYVKLKHGLDDCEATGEVVLHPAAPPRWRGVFWYWVKLAILVTCLGLLAGVFLKWVGPFFMDKEIIPIINWETTTFSTPELAVLVFASVALFPVILFPSSPSMWVAGMTFGYGYGFLLIISAVAIGISLPYFIGSLFYHKIQGWLEKYPKKASVLRSAGEGNWFHQFRAVTLIRISPFPYILYNYCAVATNVKYGPYFFGSLVGIVPEIFVAIYTGTLIRALADASHDGHTLSAPQIAFNVIGFCVSVVTTIIFTMYAKGKLKKLQLEEEPLLE